MIPSACELVNVSFELDKGGQMVEGGVPAGRNVTRQGARVQMSGRFTLEEGVPLRKKKCWRVDYLEGNATSLLISIT